MLINSVFSEGYYKFLQVSLLVVLLLAFSIKQIFLFYVSFEISLLPITFMILGYGYQPERVSAGTYIIIYTVAGSMPLLFIIIVWLGRLEAQNFFFLP